MRFRPSLAALLVAALAFQSDLAPAQSDKAQSDPARSNAACQPPKLPSGEEFVVLAAGAYSGRPIDVQLDQSGHQATQIDVTVNTGVKPVVLMLGAYEPTVWNIQWTRDSYIAAIYASGYHRQVVVGVPKTLPVLISGGEPRGPCPTFYITQESNSALNPIARRLFGQPVSMLYPAKNGAVTIGEPVSNPSLLRTSRDRVLDDYVDKNAPLAGEAGLKDGVKRGVLREATQADSDAWIAHQNEVNGPRDEPPIAGGAQRRRGVGLHRAYVVLGPFTYPAGLYGGNSATFFIPKGVPRPSGESGHSTIYDFNGPAALEEDARSRAERSRAEREAAAAAARKAEPPIALPPGFKGLSRSKIEARLIAEHPLGFHVYAAEFADAKELDDAMFWYYVGIIRLRFNAVANPNLDAKREMAAMQAMQQKLQVPLTGYTRKDPRKSADLLSKALDWDNQHGNTFTSKTAHADAYRQTRLAFEQLHGDLLMGAKLIEDARAGKPPDRAAP